MGRQVVTKSTIDQALSEGKTELALGASDIVTALAAEYAQSRGIRLVKGDAPRAATPAAAPGPAEDPTDDLAKVRSAVVTALGYEPKGLDAAIARASKQ